jgi:hypothetical protein
MDGRVSGLGLFLVKARQPHSQSPIMDVFKSLINLWSAAQQAPPIVNGMKLVVLGGTVETARKVSSSAW